MISIIIPTRNEELIIEDTLKRLRDALKSTNCEIIVSDGLSTDRTAAIAEKYADRIVLETDPSKRNIPRGKNLGAAEAKGDYLVFIDADLRIPEAESFFKKSASIFAKNPRLVGLTVSLRVSPESETFADKVIFSTVNLIHAFLNNIARFGSGSGEFQMVETSAFKRVGGYNEQLPVGEDNELFHRLARIGETKMARSLTVFHSGRRAHKIGWPRLLWSWMVNWFSVFAFKKSSSKEWQPIR